jgi:SOS-response transcriptional repressor LexA
MGALLGVTGKYVGMLERADKLADENSTISKLLAFHERRAGMSGQPVATGARAKLKLLREAKGLSQAQLAAASGYSLGVYQNIEEGLARMSRQQAERVAKALGCDPEELTNGSDHPPSSSGAFGSFGETPDIALPPGMKAKYVPLLAMAECGPLMAWDDGAYTGEGFIVFDSKDPKAFAVKLSGDSMTPKYDSGDVAIVYPSFAPRNGDVVIARLDDDHGADVMFKLYQASADKVTLSSYNTVYPPIVWPRSVFTWIYPVAQVTKTLRA